MASEMTPTRIAAIPSHSMNTPGASSSSTRNTAATMNQSQAPSATIQDHKTLSIMSTPGRPGTGPVGRRGGGALPSPDRSPPNVALAISPMPASEPSTLVASIGRISIFWFGELGELARTP